MKTKYLSIPLAPDIPVAHPLTVSQVNHGKPCAVFRNIKYLGAKPTLNVLLATPFPVLSKIFCLFCDIYKLNHSGYFYSSVEKVYEMMRFFSKEMLIDSKICLHTIDSDNNTHLKAMKVLSSEKKNPVNNHRFENKKIVVEFN